MQNITRFVIEMFIDFIFEKYSNITEMCAQICTLQQFANKVPRQVHLFDSDSKRTIDGCTGLCLRS